MKKNKDPRHKVLKPAVDAILEKLPKVVVAENVDCAAKAQSFNKLVKILKDAGYAVTWQVLNSNSWLPQHCARVYLVALLKTPTDAIDDIDSVWDALEDTWNDEPPSLVDYVDVHSNEWAMPEVVLQKHRGNVFMRNYLHAKSCIEQDNSEELQLWGCDMGCSTGCSGCSIIWNLVPKDLSKLCLRNGLIPQTPF